MVVVAAANVPTVRTVESLSTLKSAGRVAVADVPIPSKFCVYAVEVDKEIAAKTTATDIKASTEIAATMNQGLARGRCELVVRRFREVCICPLIANIGNPLGAEVQSFYRVPRPRGCAQNQVSEGAARERLRCFGAQAYLLNQNQFLQDRTLVRRITGGDKTKPVGNVR